MCVFMGEPEKLRKKNELTATMKNNKRELKASEKEFFSAVNSININILMDTDGQYKTLHKSLTFGWVEIILSDNKQTMYGDDDEVTSCSNPEAIISFCFAKSQIASSID